MLALTQDGLHIPAPAVVDWTEAIDAHIAQSEGRSLTFDPDTRTIRTGCNSAVAVTVGRNS